MKFKPEDDPLSKALQDVNTVIGDLQIHRIAQARVLRALISTHPAPDRMREAFATYCAQLSTQGYLATLSTDEGADWKHALAQALADWRGYMEQDLPAASSGQG